MVWSDVETEFHFHIHSGGHATMLIALAAPLALLLAVGEPDSFAFRLDGRVLDPTLAPIAGAEVSGTSMDGRTASPVRTDVLGGFSLLLSPGRYTVTVRAKGFQDATQTVDVGPGEGGATREFVLAVATRGESVTVHAEGGYRVEGISSATKTPTRLLDVPQSVTVVTKELIHDQLMLSVGDAMRYVPGIEVHQGENNRDQVIIRGNSSSADFFVDGVRDDVQYYRDLYNAERIEAIKGPNAMIFGRGGGGGVVNRVTKQAQFAPRREVTAQAGDYAERRATVDLDQPLGETVAVRLNGMYEDSDTFRDNVGLERWAVNPTLTVAPSPATRLTVGYEHLHDARVADRGITSYQGLPADVDVSTYYGNPRDSHVRARTDLASGTFEHTAGRLTVRNRTTFADYGRGYQNYVPRAASADGLSVSLSAYNNATRRKNLFSQTDLMWSFGTGPVKHTLLTGVELGRQRTENFRNTGYFDGDSTTMTVPFDEPTISSVATFRQSATDADNHLEASVGAAYVQDQVELSPHLLLVGGLRFDRFDLTYHNDRNGDVLSRVDDLLSPRVGVVARPRGDLSLYGSYTASYLPSSGDQFSSLTDVTEQLEPERFDNYELGAKWEAGTGLSVTAAVYRLDRTNTRATDPDDPTRIVQTGSQRTNGLEVGLAGRVTGFWHVAGGYALQDARVTSATTAAPAGARVAQVPRHSFSLWNQVRLWSRLAAAVGILYRSDVYAAIDDTVTLPGYARVDVAGFYSLSGVLRLQANLENVFDRRYFTNADNNTNISPGCPRILRVALTAGF
jgi:catecholate siderophore receptor